MFLTRPLTIFGSILIICTFFLLTYARAETLPPGSYKETCRNYTVMGYLLRAQCKKQDGSWRDTSILYNRCEGDIWNDNGELKCHGKYSYLPKGSYKETCRDYYVEGDGLKAWCKRQDGSWHNSSIDFKNCKDDIWNDNGQLTCNQYSRVPEGSYKQKCRGYNVEGNRLEAQCKKRDGTWRNTSINFKNCKGDIWNDNGELKCDRQYSNLPKGSYKESCRGYYVEDNRLYAQCKKRDGSWYNSSINFKNCKGDIWNDNGELKCK